MLDVSNCFSSENDGFTGSLDGYIINPKLEGNLLVYLQKHLSSEMADHLSQEVARFSQGRCLVLRNINVEDEYQGAGFGSQMLNALIDEHAPDCVVLILDEGESQREGFSLQTFYERQGFARAEPEQLVMIYPASFLSTYKSFAPPSPSVPSNTVASQSRMRFTR